MELFVGMASGAFIAIGMYMLYIDYKERKNR